MNFWHIQLHPDNAGAFPPDKVISILKSTSFIGLGEWGEGADQISKFKDELKRGDIVAVRSGIKPIALVEVIGDWEYSANPNADLDWFENRRKVKILDCYKDEYRFTIPNAMGTFKICKNHNADTSKVIINWFNESKARNNMNHIVDVLKFKNQIILQGPPGTGKTRLAKMLAEDLCKSGGETKLVQFHPSYTYEDFVRGISVKANGNQLEYSSENRIIGNFAQKALDNLLDSRKSSTDIGCQHKYEFIFERFKEFVQDEIDSSGKFAINDTAYIFFIESDSFRYKGDNWPYKTGLKMKFKDIIYIMSQHVDSRSSLRQLTNISGLAFQHATYYFKVIQKINEYVASNGLEIPDPPTNIALNNYVLIIDEINRANLPSVLGELIYALEYRNEPVESMYELDNSRQITLPSNLYIIGTMNTADRSVGHIDYAIRRRFAFVDVLPNLLIVEENGCPEAVEMFKRTIDLFCVNFADGEGGILVRSDYLSPEFRPEDVMLGHSYFLEKNVDNLKMRLNHEIKPILNEYLKDGILLEGAKVKIEEL